MCRLYGLRANEPTKVECSLVYAQNAMLHQSREDSRGEPNADGWGIGYYQDGCPEVERRETAAHRDEHFSVTAERVFASTVVAHVRAATVGAHSLDNTHPFVHGRWTFAHNGTVRGFETLRPRMERETDDDLLVLRRGTTDSETAFYWLLTRMRRAGIEFHRPASETEPLVRVLAEAISYLDPLCAAAEPETPAALNFLLTDGDIAVATRWRKSLSWLLRHGIHDCEICGIPHIEHSERTRYRAVVIASEPITHEEWQEVPDGSVIGVDSGALATIHQI